MIGPFQDPTTEAERTRARALDQASAALASRAKLWLELAETLSLLDATAATDAREQARRDLEDADSARRAARAIRREPAA